MPNVKLTKRSVDSALPGQTRYTLFDTEITGFGLRVSPTGLKSWIYEYRAGEGGAPSTQEEGDDRFEQAFYTRRSAN